MDNMKHRRLQELDRSDFSIVDGEPDIRGWDVKNSLGRKIGEVEELIVDAQRKKVRYMVVDLDDNDMDLEDRKVIIPIGLAELHTDDDDVILPNIEAEQLTALPEYDEDNLDDTVESKVCLVLGRNKNSEGAFSQTDEDEFYRHDHFNDDNLYKNRTQQRKASQQNKESEFDRGLMLWERRSKGGIVAGDTDNETRNQGEGRVKDQTLDRMEMVKNRRENYEQRRNRNSDNRASYQDDAHSFRKDDSIENRHRDEGLRDL